MNEPNESPPKKRARRQTGRRGDLRTETNAGAYANRKRLQDLSRRLNRPASLAELLPPVLLSIAAQAKRRPR